MSTDFPKLIDDPEDLALRPTSGTRRRASAPPGTIVIQNPKNSLFGRIVMSLVCSAVVTVITYFVQLKTFIIHVLAFVVALFGRGTYEVKSRSEDGQTQAGIPANLPGKSTIVQWIDKAGNKAKEAGVVVVTDPVTQAVKATGQKLDDAGQAVIDTKNQAFHKIDEWKEEREKKRAEALAAEKKRLLARAGELGIKVEDDWPLASIKKSVGDAEHQRLQALWKKQFNGSCPFCKQPMKVTTRGTGLYRCPCCFELAPQPMIRVLAPPMPRGFRG